MLDATADGFVVFDRVQKSYDGGTLVVKDLNLAIGKGAFLTILGPSDSKPLVSTHAVPGIEMAPHMPTNPENQGNYLVNDILWWADKQDDLEARFQSWLAQ